MNTSTGERASLASPTQNPGSDRGKNFSVGVSTSRPREPRSTPPAGRVPTDPLAGRVSTAPQPAREGSAGASLSLICGLPGAGKTTLAKRLERDKRLLRLCPDEWIAALIEDASDLAELDRLRAPTEALQWGTAGRVLTLGLDVALDFGFWYRKDRLNYLARAGNLGVQVELYLCEAPREELWRRLAERNAASPPGTFQVSKDQLDEWYPLFESPEADELALYHAWHLVG